MDSHQILKLMCLVLVSVSLGKAYHFPEVHIPLGFAETLVLDTEIGRRVPQAPLQSQEDPTVTTPQGRIQGKYSSLGARVFKSIPFAKPPVGPLRWQDPQPIDKFPENPLLATKDPNMCPQDCKLMGCNYTISEDCLYLNVYAPPNEKPDSPYPVMVFIYGGAFIMGYSAAPIYDGEYIASRTGTILVTLNYRLGALGFLAFEEKGTENTINGNFGFKDQQLAMKWVKENIANFGGDSNNITLFGESAGASSVGIHMCNPESAKLFNRAIIESDPFSIEYLKVPKARELGQRFASAVKCDTIDCLKKVDYSVIVKEQMSVVEVLLIYIPPPGPFKTKFQLLMAWAPLVDGEVLTSQPVELFASSKLAANVPFMIGTNYNEGRALALPIADKIPLFGPLVYRYLVEVFFHKENYHQVLEQYPPKWWPWHYQYNRDLFAKLFTDYMFVCPTWHAVEDVKTGHGKWVYIFDQPYTHKKNAKTCEGYSCHGDELPYVFHTTKQVFGDPTNDELRLEEIMMTYWVNFAHNGDPNIHYDKAHDSTLTAYIKEIQDDGVDLIQWPDFGTNKEIRLFNTVNASIKHLVDQYPQKEKCNFFDSLIPNYNMCFNNDC